MMKDKMKKMSDMEKNAKMSVLKDARDMAASAMGKKLHGLKDGAEAHVLSSSKEGLSAGLDKAKEMLDSGPMDEMDHMKAHGASEIDDDMAHESEDDMSEPEEMPSNEPDMSDEEEHEVDDHHAPGPKSMLEKSPESAADEDEIDMSSEHPSMNLEEIEKKMAHLHSMRSKLMGK
jgi:hypothetical protein